MNLKATYTFANRRVTVHAGSCRHAMSSSSRNMWELQADTVQGALDELSRSGILETTKWDGRRERSFRITPTVHSCAHKAQNG